ncbi:MAG: hypothetical protein ACOH2M_21495 [Cypionkella sp.]
MSNQTWEQAAAAAFGRLTEPHIAKKRATIVALVDARLAGTTEEAVWLRADTCSRTVYHNKWKIDPVFAETLASVTKLANDWHNGRAARALGEAAERLALASPAAVGKLIDLLRRTQDEAMVLRTAVAILDRAGVETAVKAKSVVEVETSRLLSDDEQAAVVAAMRAAAASTSSATGDDIDAQ